MRRLNYEVDGKKRTPKDVAAEWLNLIDDKCELCSETENGTKMPWENNSSIVKISHVIMPIKLRYLNASTSNPKPVDYGYSG